MKIEQVNPPTPAAEQANRPMSPKDRAIAAFNNAAKQQTRSAEQPVPNATNISPEEFSAVQPPKEADEEPAAAEASATESVEGQTPTVEDPAPEATKVEPPLSSQYAQLARKEKALRAQSQQMKAKEAELAAREAALQPKAEPKQEFDPSKYVSIEELKSNAWKKLQDIGVTGDELAQQQLYAPSQETVQLQNHIRQLEAKLTSLEEGQTKTLKSIEEQQTTQYKQTIASITREVDKLVASDTNFETIAVTKSTKAVVDLIEKTYKEDGVVLDIEEAAQLVEDHLAEKYTKIASIKKIQQRMQAAQAANASKTPASKQNETPKQPKQTLSNTMAANRPLTAKERAILAFENKLKS
jgi:hypothetical protein